MTCDVDHMISSHDLAGLRMYLSVDVDVPVPDEVLRHRGGLVHGGEEPGRGGEGREEGAGLQPHHGSVRWVSERFPSHFQPPDSQLTAPS